MFITYEKIDDAVVYGVFRTPLSDFEQYGAHILVYLEKDKGRLEPSKIP